MRTIKFRGRGKFDSKWIFGYLMQMYADNRLFIGQWINIGGEASVKDELFYSYKEVRPETVGQFTGLCDKDGKEIYEGDIVELKDYTGVVIWHDKYAQFKIKITEYSVSSIFEQQCKVIGNIYENEELLK